MMFLLQLLLLWLSIQNFSFLFLCESSRFVLTRNFYHDLIDLSCKFLLLLKSEIRVQVIGKHITHVRKQVNRTPRKLDPYPSLVVIELASLLNFLLLKLEISILGSLGWVFNIEHLICLLGNVMYFFRIHAFKSHQFSFYLYIFKLRLAFDRWMSELRCVLL